MGRTTYGFVGVLLLTLLIFGAVADRALVDQGRRAAETSRAEHQQTARLAAQSVRAALADVEQAVLGDSPWPGVIVGRLVDSSLSAPRPSAVPYLERTETELVALLSSTTLSDSGLPEAVVAAVALGRHDSMTAVADRLLSGRLPVRTGDLPYLADVLGAGRDPRVTSLQTQLQRAPDAATLPVTPVFQRALTDRLTIEGWSRTEIERRRYEISAGELLKAAGVASRASVSRESSTGAGHAERIIVAVPDVDGLELAYAPDWSARLRLQALRFVLWAAVLTSILGLAAVIRGLRREAGAVAREKAFVSSVTHELRTPLAAIRLLGERLAGERGDPKEYGSMVAAESERLEGLVERVLTATRADEKLSYARVGPAELVRSAVTLVSASAEKRAVTVSLEPSIRDQTLPDATWDADAVRRALLNLLDNAIRHGRHGGRVTVGASVEDGFVRLSVADDGPGIGRRDRKRVFGRFERGPADSAGTGLGLYVVERIALAHGGRVELSTDEGHGCRFTLVLPVVPPASGAGEARTVTA